MGCVDLSVKVKFLFFSYVGIAIGCTGGKHRSVVMAEEITKWLKTKDNDAVVLHRDMKEA